MRHNPLKRTTGILPALLLLLTMAAGTASAMTYDLCAGQGSLTMPEGQVVTVWGFGMDTGGQCVPTIPGPTLRVDPTDPTLTVNLRNTLAEPVSLQILGQQLAVNSGPVWDNEAVGARPNLAARVRSFSHEASPGGTATYTWGTAANPFKPGTWQILSGTHPAKQVEMGLSAPVIKDVAAGVAYPGVPYEKEVILVFQEMDAAIHAAVSGTTGSYGPGGTIKSSAYRDPTYFLINGMAHPNPGLDPVSGSVPINVGERTLIRFINAGGETHVPQILNNYMRLVAEDGIPLRYAQERYGLELNPAKTLDAVLTPELPGRFPVLDGRLSLTNAGVSPGGMLAYLNVAAVGTDTVIITNVEYIASRDRLLVEATSSAQPDVTLTAEGFGTLSWDSTRNLYRRVFTNVTVQPASVTVTSSAGGSDTYTTDTVNITRAAYNATRDQLLVEATSSAQPSVTLNAVGYGSLLWDGARNLYRRVFSNVANKPADVTVTSSGGGSATQAVQ